MLDSFLPKSLAQKCSITVSAFSSLSQGGHAFEAVMRKREKTDYFNILTDIIFKNFGSPTLYYNLLM